MKRLFILFAIILISCTCCQSCHEIKVMDYNIRNCVGMDNNRDIDRVAKIIADEDPDYIALQEIDSLTARSENRYILGELADILKMNATFAPAIDYDGGKYGIGLLSKQKPIKYSYYPLPGDEEQRVLLVVEFPEIYICTTHLSLNKKNREESVDTILDIINDLDKPVIFTGDLNSLPESEVIKDVSSKLTTILSGENTFPSDFPEEAIDYIFGKKVSKVATWVINDNVASDHRPIVAIVKTTY